MQGASPGPAGWGRRGGGDPKAGAPFGAAWRDEGPVYHAGYVEGRGRAAIGAVRRCRPRSPRPGRSAGGCERARGNRPRMRAKDRGPARREPPPPGVCPSRYPGCPMRIVYVVGAQPNFIKMAPVVSDRSQIGQRRRMRWSHQLSKPGIGSMGSSPWTSSRPIRSFRSRGRSARRLKATTLLKPATRNSTPP